MAHKGSHFAPRDEAVSSVRQTGARGKRAAQRAVPPVLVGIAVVVLVLCVAGGAYAWLVQSDFANNVFGIGGVDITVEEKGPGEEPFKEGDTVKRDVKVTNEGNMPVYVRAQVLVYWVDVNDNQLWEEPSAEDGDYNIIGSLPANDGWTKNGDYYYWTKPLDVSASTEQLINSITASKDYGDGRRLVVDVLVQGIQAEPQSAVEEAWSVSVAEDGTLSATVSNDGTEA